MNIKKDELLKRLLVTFKAEAEEHLVAISSGLLEFEKQPAPEKRAAIIETIFREMHSLKGAARSVSMTDIESISRYLESVFSSWKSQNTSPTREQFDVLHYTIDSMSKLVNSPADGHSLFMDIEQKLNRIISDDQPDIPVSTTVNEKDEELHQIKEVEAENLSEVVPEKNSIKNIPLDEYKPQDIIIPESAVQTTRNYTSKTESPKFSKTVRISTNKLDKLLFLAEEFITAKQMTNQRVADFGQILENFELIKNKWTKAMSEVKKIRHSSIAKSKGKQPNQLISQSEKLLELIEGNSGHIKSVEEKVLNFEKNIDQDNRFLDTMVDNLLEDMKDVLMMPISYLLGIFPKHVRNLCREQGKETELIINGSEIEIDRRILENIKDPIVHLIRNCIDHGIEKPETRRSINKPPCGTITISVSRKENKKIEIIVSDDGGGIDIKKVKEAAKKLGILSKQKEKELKKHEALLYVFESGISTNSIITDISGRGLGLAIVREKIEKLGGEISLESEPQKGSTFKLIFPITLATFRGVLVKSGDQKLVIPIFNVERFLRVKNGDIKTIENKSTISHNGTTIPLVGLEKVLELTGKENGQNNSEYTKVLVLNADEKRIAFSIDDVLNEQEILVKDLGSQLSRVRNISGAAVLGSGMVVPILNVSDMMKSAVYVTTDHEGSDYVTEKIKEKKKKILVVEDSITSRTLLKSILEIAGGYNVKIAVDGVEAFTLLKTEDFDLVVSDVDMPRMNGFVLTSKIRDEKRIAELPVVLVTALEERREQEMGIDAGADAYIIKSSFDQSNLLETVQRLI